MLLYHGSNIAGLTRLEPRLADHNRPYVYMTTLEAVAAFYLCNAVEKPYYWFPYGFDGNNVPVYHELYPGALRQVSEGVSGCIYTVMADDQQVIPFKNIPCARLATQPVDIIGCTEIPDAYQLFRKYIREGRMKLSRYEDKTPEQLEHWYSMVAAYLAEKDMIKSPDCSYARFVREKLPRAWEIYLENTAQAE